jgi:uncharacterized protein
MHKPFTLKKCLLSMDPKLLEILVCPVTKGPLIYDKVRKELVSKSARLAYPIRDDIPVMLEEEARALSADEVAALA